MVGAHCAGSDDRVKAAALALDQKDDLPPPRAQLSAVKRVEAEKPSTGCAATLTPVSLRSSRLGVAPGCGAAGRASRKLNPCEKTRASAASSRRKESCGRHRARQSRRSRLHGYLPARELGRSDSQHVGRGGEQGLRFCRTKQGCPMQKIWFKPGVPRIGSWSAQATVTSSSAPDSAAYARGRSPLTLGSSSGRMQRAPLPLSLGSVSRCADRSQAGTQLTGQSRAEIGAGPKEVGSGRIGERPPRLRCWPARGGRVESARGGVTRRTGSGLGRRDTRLSASQRKNWFAAGHRPCSESFSPQSLLPAASSPTCRPPWSRHSATGPRLVPKTGRGK